MTQAANISYLQTGCRECAVDAQHLTEIRAAKAELRDSREIPAFPKHYRLGRLHIMRFGWRLYVEWN